MTTWCCARSGASSTRNGAPAAGLRARSGDRGTSSSWLGGGLGDVLERIAREIEERVLERRPRAVELVQSEPALGDELARFARARDPPRRARPRRSTSRLHPRRRAAAITSVTCGVRTCTRPSDLEDRSSLTLAWAIRRPRPMTTSSSAMPSSSLMRWLDTSTVRPSSASSRRKPRIQRIPSGSSPLTGSSSTSTGGSPSMAAAIPSRCAMPSEKPPVRLRPAAERPTSSEHVVDASGREAIAPREPQQVATRTPARMRRAGVEEGADRSERRGEVAVPAPAHQDVSGVGCIESQEHPHRRRLPCAVRPDEPGDATCVDREGQVVHGNRPAVSLRETADFDGCAHPRKR